MLRETPSWRIMPSNADIPSTCLLILILILISTSCSAGGDEVPLYIQEKRLMDRLKAGSDPTVFPAADRNTPFDVKFGIHLQTINTIDEVNHRIELNVWANMEWRDPRLSWTEADYGGINNVRIPATDVWTPDIQLYNSVYNSHFPMDTLVVVYSSGVCTWLPSVTLLCSCAMDLRHFPYDTQTCLMKFGSWTYDGDMLNLQSMFGDTLDVSHYIPNTDWTLTDWKTSRNVLIYECCPEPYIDVTLTLTLERRSTHAVYMYVLPALILGLLVPFIFLTHPTGTQRSIHGATVIISISVFFDSLDWMMSNLQGFPKLGVLYVEMFVLSALALVVANLVSLIAGKTCGSPHRCTRKSIGLLGKLLCVCDQDLVEDKDFVYENEAAEINGRKRATAAPHSGYWMYIARVLDRLFFIVFLLVILILIFVFYL